MVRAKKIRAYQCRECDQIYEDEQEARYCCPIEEVEAYKCGDCDEIYEDRDEAKECCK